MALQPLTPTGVKDKQDELYALSDPALAAEAEAIRTDFRTWMTNNFSLTIAQETYLDNLPDDVVDPLATNTSTAIAFRLPIILVITGTISASKLIRTRPEFEFFYNPVIATGQYTVTGSMTVEFEYL